MTNWIRAQKPAGSPEKLGPLQLAWLGDAIWELHQRLRHCSISARSKDLHRAVVSEVKASAQAISLSALEPYLDDQEKMLVKKGRNKSRKGPRGADAATYGKATGFETMVGWLFLNNPERLAQLFDRLEESESNTFKALKK